MALRYFSFSRIYECLAWDATEHHLQIGHLLKSGIGQFGELADIGGHAGLCMERHAVVG